MEIGTELLQAQHATFESLDATIQELQDQLGAERAKIAALADKGMLTVEELKEGSESEFELSILLKAIARAEINREKVYAENAPLVYQDAREVIAAYKKTIEDKHLADFALIQQKEEEIKAIKETIKASERMEIGKMDAFVHQVKPFLLERFHPTDVWDTPASRLGELAAPKAYSGDFLKTTIFNKGENN